LRAKPTLTPTGSSQQLTRSVGKFQSNKSIKNIETSKITKTEITSLKELQSSDNLEDNSERTEQNEQKEIEGTYSKNNANLNKSSNTSLPSITKNFRNFDNDFCSTQSNNKIGNNSRKYDKYGEDEEDPQWGDIDVKDFDQSKVKFQIIPENKNQKLPVLTRSEGEFLKTEDENIFENDEVEQIFNTMIEKNLKHLGINDESFDHNSTKSNHLNTDENMFTSIDEDKIPAPRVAQIKPPNFGNHNKHSMFANEYSSMFSNDDTQQVHTGNQVNQQNLRGGMKMGMMNMPMNMIPFPGHFFPNKEMFSIPPPFAVNHMMPIPQQQFSMMNMKQIQQQKGKQKEDEGLNIAQYGEEKIIIPKNMTIGSNFPMNPTSFLENPTAIVQKNMYKRGWFLMTENNKILGNYNSPDLLSYLENKIQEGSKFENVWITDYETDMYFTPNNLHDVMKDIIPKVIKRPQIPMNMRSLSHNNITDFNNQIRMQPRFQPNTNCRPVNMNINMQFIKNDINLNTFSMNNQFIGSSQPQHLIKNSQQRFSNQNVNSFVEGNFEKKEFKDSFKK
jgi:hypothetical protein